ncbi:MAG: TonB-dependent receptor [Xanthomonadales bacterium]|nr:TonB-dependent receptor [Xanthomonadales bacterium]
MLSPTDQEALEKEIKMKKHLSDRRILGLLVATFATVFVPGSAAAQDLEDQNEQESAGILEEVIVTGVAKPTTKFESSASVSSLSSADMQNNAPRSTAEVFRNIPGIQAEASSGDANANIKVRGMPISSGGSRYVSLQEDGFPTLLIGDIAFATADSWLRVDNTISSVQSIRGGTASTQAFNSPGGIINFISKDGSVEGGSTAFTYGLDFDSLRLDAEYGGSINDNWSYHIGGYFRKGEGPREAPTDLEEGYQIKATFAGEFERGDIKFHLKQLDDTVPTYLPIGARYNGGTSFSQFGEVSLRDGTLYNNTTDCTPRRNNEIKCNKDGFEANMTSVAVVGNFDISDRFIVGARYRIASIDGNFAAPFLTTPFEDPSAGPSQEIIYFNTESNSMDNSFGELKLTGDFDFLQATVGIAYSSQDLSTTWNFNQYYVRLDNGLTPFDSGNSVDGVLYGNPAFGNCCTRAYDYNVDATAPYIAFNGTIGDRLGWDASYRQNDYSIKGTFAESTVLIPLDVNGDGQIGANEQAVPTIGAARLADYDQDFGSWSFGANYALTDSLAVFGNLSEGGSIASPDRVMGNLNADGTMNNGAGYATVMQAEIGIKWQFEKGSLYATYFNADTDEERAFEVTTQEFLQNSYESSGFEFEGLYDFGSGFRVQGSLTLTDSEIVKTASGDNIGNTPRRQADYIFNITPSYTSDSWDLGLNFIGTDSVYVQDNNDLKFGSYIVTNLFLNYYFNDTISISLNANNLFDEIGFTEGEEGSAVAGDLVRIRPINGRTTSLTLRYQF